MGKDGKLISYKKQITCDIDRVYNVGMEEWCNKEKVPKFSYENKYWKISEQFLHDAWEGFSWVPVKDAIEYLIWLISIKDKDRSHWTTNALKFCESLDRDDKVSCMHDDAYKAEYNDKYYEYPEWKKGRSSSLR